jgi:hypothetical protein
MQRRTEFRNVLQKWIGIATFEELKMLAKHADTSVEVIRQTANAYRNDGALSASPELAKKIEQAAAKLHRRGLPIIRREHLCPACRACDMAKHCRKTEL